MKSTTESASTVRCPECVAGKHGNCTGWAFDDHDEEISCGCSCRSEPTAYTPSVAARPARRHVPHTALFAGILATLVGILLAAAPAHARVVSPCVTASSHGTRYDACAGTFTIAPDHQVKHRTFRLHDGHTTGHTGIEYVLPASGGTFDVGTPTSQTGDCQWDVNTSDTGEYQPGQAFYAGAVVPSCARTTSTPPTTPPTETSSSNSSSSTTTSTSSTTKSSTTSHQPSTSSSSAQSHSSKPVTTAAAAVQPELAATGLSVGWYAIIALLLLGIGVLAVVAGRSPIRRH